MHKRNIHAFSLIELMVVVLIVGLIAAVGTPMYKSYLVKSKVSEVFASVAQYKNSLQAAYIDGDQFPATLSDLPAATFTTTTMAGLTLLYYGRATNNQAAYIHFFTTDLGIESFSLVAGSGAGGANDRLTVVAVSNSIGQMRFYCGQWDGSGDDLPLSYLPKNCQDTNLSALIS